MHVDDCCGYERTAAAACLRAMIYIALAALLSKGFCARRPVDVHTSLGASEQVAIRTRRVATQRCSPLRRCELGMQRTEQLFAVDFLSQSSPRLKVTSGQPICRDESGRCCCRIVVVLS